MTDDDGLWLQTYTGLAFFPLAPHPDAISIEDVAHALSLQCRFAGHTRDHYSVAQHSVLVSQKLPQPDDALWGLLHDASEAYLVDLPRPLKHHTRLGQEYRRLEERVQRAICDRFRLPYEAPAGLEAIHHRLLRTEQRDLLLPLRDPRIDPRRGDVPPYPEYITPLQPWQAELEFVLRFGELMGLREARCLRLAADASRNEASAASSAGGDGTPNPAPGRGAGPSRRW